MKKALKILSVTAFLVLAVSLNISYSQPPPGDNSNGGAVGGTPIGGGAAPVGGGLVILMALATGYGLKKTLEIRQDRNETNKT